MQVSPSELKTDYPNSDIIVYYTPDRSRFIVSRIASVEEVNGTLVFRTKGDANSAIKYPDTPSLVDCDPWEVPEDLILEKL